MYFKADSGRVEFINYASQRWKNMHTHGCTYVQSCWQLVSHRTDGVRKSTSQPPYPSPSFHGDRICRASRTEEERQNPESAREHTDTHTQSIYGSQTDEQRKWVGTLQQKTVKLQVIDEYTVYVEFRCMWVIVGLTGTVPSGWGGTLEGGTYIPLGQH